MKTTILATTAVCAMLASVPAFSTEITVWDFKSGDPTLSAYYDAVKTAFEQAHPGDTVKYVMQPHDQYYTLLGTALSSPGGPDLFMVHGGAQAKARFGAMLPLDKSIEDIKDRVAGWGDFGDATGTYAIPLSVQGFLVYYNKKLFTDAGLDAANAPTTWAELTKVCDAFKAKASVPCFAMGNKEGFGIEFWFSSIAANEWTEQEQKDFAAGNLKWSSPAVKSVLQSWVDAYKAGWFPEGANSTAKFMDEYEGFMRGEAGNTIGLISDVAHWKQFDEFLGGENDGVYALPAPTLATDKTEGKPKFPMAGGIGYAVNKSSPNAELAVSLAKTFVSADMQKIFFNDAGAMPASLDVPTSGLSSEAAKKVIALMADSGAPMAHQNTSAAELEELHRVSQLLLNGEITVDQAVERLDAVAAQAKGQ